jgi:hypothetical protein
MPGEAIVPTCCLCIRLGEKSNIGSQENNIRNQKAINPKFMAFDF